MGQTRCRRQVASTLPGAQPSWVRPVRQLTTLNSYPWQLYAKNERICRVARQRRPDLVDLIALHSCVWKQAPSRFPGL